MDVTFGCSLNDLRTHEHYRQSAVINVEDPLFPGYLDQDYRDDLEYLQRECHQRLILDGPYIDLNLGSPEPRARKLAQEKVWEAIEYAQQCHAEAIVFLSTFLPFIGLQSYEQNWIAESIRSWQGILDRDPGVRIAVCNTFEFNPDNLLEIVAALDHPKFELAFDVGHCLVWGRLPAAQWYRKIRDRCRIVYMHSNDGQADQHRSIRVGRLAEEEILKDLSQELRADSVLILKYFEKGSVIADIEFLVKNLGHHSKMAE
jgi:sugar phosphate isomerase/epimerase